MPNRNPDNQSNRPQIRINPKPLTSNPIILDSSAAPIPRLPLGGDAENGSPTRLPPLL